MINDKPLLHIVRTNQPPKTPKLTDGLTSIRFIAVACYVDNQIMDCTVNKTSTLTLLEDS